MAQRSSREFGVEYRRQSGGRSGWKRCKSTATLTLGDAAPTSGGRQLRYVVTDAQGKTHEDGCLHEQRSRVELGNAGLKAELQATTLCISQPGTGAGSFAVTFLSAADAAKAKALFGEVCALHAAPGVQAGTPSAGFKRPRGGGGGSGSAAPQKRARTQPAAEATSMGPPAPRAARALVSEPARDELLDIDLADDQQLEDMIRDCVEDPVSCAPLLGTCTNYVYIVTSKRSG